MFPRLLFSELTLIHLEIEILILLVPSPPNDRSLSDGLGLSIYSQDARKTTRAPGITRGPKLALKRTGDIESRIAVEMPAAKDLTSASASARVSHHERKYSRAQATKLTFVDGRNGQTDRDVAYNDQYRTETIESLEEPRFVWFEDSDHHVRNQIDCEAGDVENNVVCVQAGVVSLQQCLVVDASASAEENLELKDQVCTERIPDTCLRVVLGHQQAAKLSTS